jgi:hypothetical protein
MGSCAYLVLSLYNQNKAEDLKIDQNITMIAAAFGGQALGGVYKGVQNLVDSIILSTNNPGMFKKLSHKETASHIFHGFSQRFEKHIRDLPQNDQNNIKMTRLAVVSKLQEDKPNLSELKIAIERYLIEIAFTAMERVDAATFDGDKALQNQSDAEFQRFLLLYPEKTREGLEMLNQHVEDISKSKNLPRRNFFLQSDKEIAQAGGMGKSLAIKTYCQIKGKNFLKFSVGERGLWHLTGMYNTNARFDFSVEHNMSLAPLVFEVMQAHDEAPIVFLEEAGEAVANSSAQNSHFNRSAMKNFSDTDIQTMVVPGWANREIDISGWTLVAAGNIDITDTHETEVGKTPAAVSRRWDPIPFCRFGYEEKSRVFDNASKFLNTAFKENGKMPPDMLDNIAKDLESYREFIIENDTHPGAPGVMRATDHAARYIRLGYQKGKPFKNIEIEKRILEALRQVEQVDSEKSQTSTNFDKPGYKLGDGEETHRTFQIETPEKERLRNMLADAADARLKAKAEKTDAEPG